VREFVFTPSSNEDDAHIVETKESREKNRPSRPEDDQSVIKEMENVS
jgi:hypothetical protein